jgi:hypothetical protein
MALDQNFLDDVEVAMSRKSRLLVVSWPMPGNPAAEM